MMLRTWLVLVVVLIASFESGDIAAQVRGQNGARARALEMFARSYYPGRSGQIMIVPREGSIIVSRKDPVVTFMHGSPWPYDTRIPLLLYGTPYVRKGIYSWPCSPAGRDADRCANTGSVRAGDRHGPAADRSADRRQHLPARCCHRRPRWDAPGLFRSARGSDAHAHATPSRRRVVCQHGDRLPADHYGARPHHRFERDRPAIPRHDRQFDVRPCVAQAAGNICRQLAARFHGDEPGGRVEPAHTRSEQSSSRRAAAVRPPSGLPAMAPVSSAAIGFALQATAAKPAPGRSNDACYDLPPYVARRNAREIWEQAGGTWMGHAIANPDAVRRTSLFARFEADTLLSMIDGEGVGADDTADLVLVNFKTPDFVAHQYGPASPELRETLAELDRQFGRVLKALEQKAKDRFVVAITADHGMPGEPSGKAVRVYTEDIIKAVHDRFDPEGRLVQQYEPENNQLAIDVERVAELRHSLNDVAQFLEQQPFVFAAFTEDEVRRASAFLHARITIAPPRRSRSRQSQWPATVVSCVAGARRKPRE